MVDDDDDVDDSRIRTCPVKNPNEQSDFRIHDSTNTHESPELIVDLRYTIWWLIGHNLLADCWVDLIISQNLALIDNRVWHNLLADLFWGLIDWPNND